jgi:hypothetical protein
MEIAVSIKMLFTKGLWCPMFVCDVCGKVIKERRLAAAVFDMDGPKEKSLTEVQHVHKGACLNEAERRIGKFFGWTELRDHIQFLRENVKDCPRTPREDMP